MFANLAFTIYDFLGYLVPGLGALIGVVVFDNALLHPKMQLTIRWANSDIAILVLSLFCAYLLGHACQSLANLFWRNIESNILDSDKGSAPAALRCRAKEIAVEISGDRSLSASWIFRILEEYVMQRCKPGLGEILVYREGFYRGTAVSLVILLVGFLARAVLSPGEIVVGTMAIDMERANSVLVCVLAIVGFFLFVRRYKRFAEYRVMRVVLAAVSFQDISGPSANALER
jgi:hypothetical protein